MLPLPAANEGSGRIKFFTIHKELVAGRFDLRLEIHHLLGAGLRKCVSEAFDFEAELPR
jgi:hypothetical protein